MALLECMNCKCSSSSRNFKISSKCPNTDATVWQALLKVLPSLLLSPIKHRKTEERFVCRQCAGRLGKAYNSILAFTDCGSEKSYLNVNHTQQYPSHSCYAVPGTCTPDSRTPPYQGGMIKKTPLSEKLRKARMSYKGRNVIQTSVVQTCKAEMIAFMKVTKLNCQGVSIDKVPSLEEIETELRSHAPLTLSILKALAGCRQSATLTYRMYAAVCVLALDRTNRCNMFQKFISLLLMRSKAPDEMYSTFNKYGICVSKKCMEDTLENLSKEYNHDILQWKQGLETSILGPRYTGVETLQPRARKRLKFDSGEMAHTYAVVFDNVNKYVSPRDVNSGFQARQVNVVSAIGVLNRVPVPITYFNDHSERQKAVTVPMHTFLLTQNDMAVLKQECILLIKKCLVDHLEMFAKCQSDVRKAKIPNVYMNESSTQSKTVNLGLLLHDENTTGGMIKILEELQKYCPKVGEEVKDIVCWGDGLTASRIEGAKLHRSISVDKNEHLRGLVPGVGHWHRRALLLGDDMKSLLKDVQQTRSRGSLPFLRARFNYHAASLDMKTKFNETFAFFKFVWQSYVVALACKYLKITEPSEVPTNENETGLDDLLEQTATSILEFCWCNMQDAANQETYCVCNSPYDPEDSERKWIACDNPECPLMKWYHVNCVTFEGIVGSEDEAENDSENEVESDDDTQASIKKAFSKRRKWYCSKGCRKAMLDKKLSYSKAVIFGGLMNEGFRDAVRENDGERLVVHYKRHLIQFFNRRHRIYSKICVNMLYNISHHGSNTVRHDLKWNSTVNVAGVRGKNIGLDLYNEFVNKTITSFCFNGRAISDSTITKRSQAIGILSEIASCISKHLVNESDMQISGKTKKWKQDVPECVKILNQEKLFDHCGKRFHSGFENFSNHYMYIADKSVFVEKVRNICRQIDEVHELETEDCF